MVSCAGADEFDAELVRMICADARPQGAGFEEQVLASSIGGKWPGRAQATVPGSYGLARGAPLADLRAGFTLSVIVRPTFLGLSEQTILGNWRGDLEAGYALVLRD